MPRKKEYLENPEIPDSVRRVGRVLFEVADAEIPPLDVSNDSPFVTDVYGLDHPFGQAYRRTYDAATANFRVVRPRHVAIDINDPDDCTHLQASHPDRWGSLALCSIAMYVDGTLRIRSEIKNESTGSKQKFVEVSRGSLTLQNLREAVESVTHPNLE